jgi:hypothetical protein
MYFLNAWAIDEAVDRLPKATVAGRAARFLAAFRDEVDAHSDGWAHWRQPVAAAEKLMVLLSQPDDATEELFRKALTPIRSFYTRLGSKQGMKFPEESAAKEMAVTDSVITLRLREIGIDKQSCEHGEITAEKLYVAIIHGRPFIGEFSRQWYGLRCRRRERSVRKPRPRVVVIGLVEGNQNDRFTRGVHRLATGGGRAQGSERPVCSARSWATAWTSTTCRPGRRRAMPWITWAPMWGWWWPCTCTASTSCR